MPVFFFISGYLIRRYIDEVNWRDSVDKRSDGAPGARFLQPAGAVSGVHL
jgi:uncharacterized membrane protein YcfT